MMPDRAGSSFFAIRGLCMFAWPTAVAAPRTSPSWNARLERLRSYRIQCFPMSFPYDPIPDRVLADRARLGKDHRTEQARWRWLAVGILAASGAVVLLGVAKRMERSARDDDSA